MSPRSTSGLRMRLWRDDADFAQRYGGRFDADGSAIRGAWERSDDGTRWEHGFSLDYARLS